MKDPIVKTNVESRIWKMNRYPVFLISQKSFFSISPKDKIFLNYENLKPIFL